MELVSHIIDTKLNEEIREKKSLTYSINCSFLAHESLPERGMLYTTFSSAPTMSEKTLALARKIVESFRGNSISEEQLGIARKQALHILERKQKNIHYWSNWLSGLNYRLRDYDFPYLKQSLLEQITVEDVQKALGKIITQENYISLITKSKTDK